MSTVNQKWVLEVLLWRRKTKSTNIQTAEHFQINRNTVNTYVAKYNIEHLQKKFPEFVLPFELPEKLINEINDAAEGILVVNKKCAQVLSTYLDVLIDRLGTKGGKVNVFEAGLVNKIYQVSSPYVVAQKNGSGEKPKESSETMFEKVRKQCEQAVTKANITASKIPKNARKPS